MKDRPLSEDSDRTRQERDLYLRLLELSSQAELKTFLREALALVGELAGANQGYLELADDRDAPSGSPWWIAHGFSDAEVDAIRATISRGIIAEAIASGETVVTPSALLDPRFRDRESVRIGRIEAVLCVPVGSDPPVGVVYLQGRRAAGPFPPEDQANAEIFARHIAPIVHNLLARERQEPDQTLPYRRTLRIEGIVGHSRALATILRQAALVCPLDVSVLITGQTGTGKSQIARLIHDNGPRSGHSFVELNCAALPESLIESELFGALSGAHSTATRRIEGKVAVAEKGTLFLDEIGELTAAAQAKLLHLLHSKQYYPLGSSKAVAADVRVIAATNANLAAAVSQGRFREDLFYRLQVLPIRVPSLAERWEDIPDLAAFFVAGACERHHLPFLQLSRGAVRSAQAAEWPGNVRQLAHAMEAAAIRAAGEGATAVERSHIFPEDASTEDETRKAVTFQEATRRFQARLLGDTLEQTEWNIAEVARRLDLARSHVYNLIRAFGLEKGRMG